MRLRKSIFGAAIILPFSSLVCSAQTTNKRAAPPPQIVVAAGNQAAKSSPAYAELLLQKTELEAQLEDLVGDFNEEFPKIKALRFELNLISRAADKFLAVAAGDAPKLSLALGRLTVRKIELETALWSLQQQYKDDYPDVLRLKRKVAVFDRAIREIMPTF